MLLLSFLDSKFGLEDSLGSFKGYMASNIEVQIPVLSYGITENITLAIAAPFYNVSMNVNLDFNVSQNGKDFVSRLSSPEYNQVKKAREVSDKLNNAVESLQEQLTSNGYKPLNKWSEKGFGDIILMAKYRFYNKSILKFANTTGVTLPTGRSKKLDVLNDMDFGKGTTAFFSGLYSDQVLTKNFLLNEYIKGTFYFPNQKTVRLITEGNPIVSEKKNAEFQLGSQIEVGFSGQFKTDIGIEGGLGYVHEQKFKDSYRVEKNPLVAKQLEKDTNGYSHHLVGKLVYSSIPAFQKKKAIIPAIASLEYRRQIGGVNMPEQHRLSVDILLFF